MSFSRSFTLPSYENLTPHDWKLLITNSQLVKFEKSEKIIEQSKNAPFMYILKTGAIRFVRNKREGDSISSTFITKCRRKNYLFGHHSVFRSTFRSPFDVVAETKVEVLQLNVAFINKFLQSNPKLAVRFYSEIGRNLTETIKLSFSGISRVSLLVQIPRAKADERSMPHSFCDYFPELLSQTILYGKCSY